MINWSFVRRTGTRWPAVSVALFCGVTAAQSQIVATPVNTDRMTPAKVTLVKPDGTKVKATSDLKIEQRTEWIEKDQTVQDYLRRNNLTTDKKAITTFKALNPQVRADGTIPAGSKVSVFVTNADTDGSAGSPAMAKAHISDLTRVSFSRQVAEANQIKLATAQVPQGAYLRKDDMVLHRKLVSDVDRTASLVASRADKLSAKDLALSRYYLSSANATAAKLSTVAVGATIPSKSLSILQNDVAPVQQMEARMLNGQPPIDYRDVEVQVKTAPGAATPPKLRVYVLPGGCLDVPKNCEEFLQDLLVNLTFENLTTPSKSKVQPADMRVWVGLDNAYAAMAKLVLSGAAIPFTPVRPAPGNETLVISFSAPDQIVRP